jgi:hypothetical protein
VTYAFQDLLLAHHFLQQEFASIGYNYTLLHGGLFNKFHAINARHSETDASRLDKQESGALVYLIYSLGCGVARVSFETSFDSKQPKLEPKHVSALSETKRLFRLFRFYTETECFDVSIEPKQTKDQPKQFDREHILQFFT